MRENTNALNSYSMNSISNLSRLIMENQNDTNFNKSVIANNGFTPSIDKITQSNSNNVD
jgi:hypothetical protein